MGFVRFADRKEAGQKLAEVLAEKVEGECVVYALPRGGVVVAAEIANKLKCPLDLVITRKVGHPQNPEYAVAVVAEDGHTITNQREVGLLDKKWFAAEVRKEQQEAKRRREAYLRGAKPIDPRGKTAVIVDDGIATGLSLKLAVKEVKELGPARIVVAVPVAPADSADEISAQVDEFIALDIPRIFMGAVGAYYDDFAQTTDEEVISLLGRGR